MAWVPGDKLIIGAAAWAPLVTDCGMTNATLVRTKLCHKPGISHEVSLLHLCSFTGMGRGMGRCWAWCCKWRGSSTRWCPTWATPTGAPTSMATTAAPGRESWVGNTCIFEFLSSIYFIFIYTLIANFPNLKGTSSMGRFTRWPWSIR